MSRRRGERDHDNPTGLDTDLILDGYVKGTAEYRREYSRRYYHARAKTKSYAAGNPGARYGLTAVQVDAMFDACRDSCQCCGSVVKRHNTGAAKADVGNIDHDHATGKVRGILCNPCNQGIGLLRDKPHLAVAYLQGTHERTNDNHPGH